MRRDVEKRGGVYRFREFNENHRLLERFLESQIGRPWDKVYSEIRSNPDSRRGIGLSVLQRIKRLVATDCFLENKQVLRPGYWGPYPPRDFYVHPVTGRLLRPRPRRYERPRPDVTRIMIDDLHWFEKIEGIWYRLDHEIHRDSWLGRNWESRVQIGKKQCSKKELKRIATNGVRHHLHQILHGKVFGCSRRGSRSGFLPRIHACGWYDPGTTWRRRR